MTDGESQEYCQKENNSKFRERPDIDIPKENPKADNHY
jgi:hypothetical protein